MAAPTYFLASRMLEDAGYKGKLRAVPQVDEGMDVNYLRQELTRTEALAPAKPTANSISKPSSQYPKIYQHLIYAVPTFSNPTSLTMSLDRRQRLVRIAREFDALIITDDVYAFLQWATNCESGFDPTRSILPRIVDIDSELDGGPERAGSDGFGNAVSNGSFSKIVGPGCRTGWAEGTEKLIDSLSQVYQTLLSAIKQHLYPLGVSVKEPASIAGGYYVWLTLPEPLTADSIALRAKKEQNLTVPSGSMFEVWGDEDASRSRRNLRLSFAWEAEDRLAEAIIRLGRVIATSVCLLGSTHVLA